MYNKLFIAIKSIFEVLLYWLAIRSLFFFIYFMQNVIVGAIVFFSITAAYIAIEYILKQLYYWSQDKIKDSLYECKRKYSPLPLIYCLLDLPKKFRDD